MRFHQNRRVLITGGNIAPMQRKAHTAGAIVRPWSSHQYSVAAKVRMIPAPRQSTIALRSMKRISKWRVSTALVSSGRCFKPKSEKPPKSAIPAPKNIDANWKELEYVSPY